ncbi:MAG: citramalate synthase, partial [Bdellovibrionales bacterium]|nr:citramalate synthase [Bdellovibrionales bacterium]
ASSRMRAMTPTQKIFLYDTTLRDGTQQRGMSLTLEDKLKLTRLIDSFGIPYIEGGWPGANPKDSEYFRRVRELPLRQAKVAAFGSTRRANTAVEDDKNLAALLDAETPVVTIVGKSWRLHVEQILETSLEENLAMIAESVRFLKEHGKEVIYDAEHFFDGYRADGDYALATLEAAAQGGADWIVLCDTNGGTLPSAVYQAVSAVRERVTSPIGIHTHNDSGTAVANSLAAVEAGARQIQGTINGYGERCGNADLVTLLPSLQLKLGFECVPVEQLAHLTFFSREVSEIANFNQNLQAPYVGACAFAHKGGLHVAAVAKLAESYEHVKPELVGNSRESVISELSGRGNVRVLAENLGLDVDGEETAILQQVKELEQSGYQFEHAEGSVELLIRRRRADYVPPFVVEETLVVSASRHGAPMTVEAVVKVRVGESQLHTAAAGDGPVHALDCALRKALEVEFPGLAAVQLSDYKVRILNPDRASSAKTRVLIEASNGRDRWSTVGCSENIIEASVQALADCYELYLLRVAA